MEKSTHCGEDHGKVCEKVYNLEVTVGKHESRLSGLEKLMWAALGVVGIFSPVFTAYLVFTLIKH